MRTPTRPTSARPKLKAYVPDCPCCGEPLYVHQDDDAAEIELVCWNCTSFAPADDAD